MVDLFGDAPEPAPKRKPPAKPKPPPKPTAKQLREQAPPPRLAPARRDDTLDAIRVLGAFGMLHSSERTRYAEPLAPTIPPGVRVGLAEFRSKHGLSEGSQEGE